MHIRCMQTGCEQHAEDPRGRDVTNEAFGYSIAAAVLTVDLYICGMPRTNLLLPIEAGV